VSARVSASRAHHRACSWMATDVSPRAWRSARKRHLDWHGRLLEARRETVLIACSAPPGRARFPSRHGAGRWPRASFRAGCSRHNRTAARGRRHLATCASEDNGFARQLRLSLQGTYHQSSGNQLRSQSPTCTSSNDRWCCSGKPRCRDKRASGPGRNSPRRCKRFVR
jgi:hypothetical protein